jgi:hypothetical protein
VQSEETTGSVESWQNKNFLLLITDMIILT